MDISPLTLCISCSKQNRCACNSSTIGCPPVRGENPRALATYISVDLAHHEIVGAKAGKGGIMFIFRILFQQLDDPENI